MQSRQPKSHEQEIDALGRRIIDLRNEYLERHAPRASAKRRLRLRPTAEACWLLGVVAVALVAIAFVRNAQGTASRDRERATMAAWQREAAAVARPNWTIEDAHDWLESAGFSIPPRTPGKDPFLEGWLMRVQNRRVDMRRPDAPAQEDSYILISGSKPLPHPGADGKPARGFVGFRFHLDGRYRDVDTGFGARVVR